MIRVIRIFDARIFTPTFMIRVIRMIDARLFNLISPLHRILDHWIGCT